MNRTRAKQLIVSVAAAVSTVACNGERPSTQAAAPLDSAATSSGAAKSSDSVPAAAVDLGKPVQQPVVIYVEATPAEIGAARGNTSESDFQVIADDLMFYRASAIEYLEKHKITFTRATGHRPLVFLVKGAPRTYDFKDVT